MEYVRYQVLWPQPKFQQRKSDILDMVAQKISIQSVRWAVTTYKKKVTSVKLLSSHFIEQIAEVMALLQKKQIQESTGEKAEQNKEGLLV